MVDRPLARRNARATKRLRGAFLTDRSHVPGIQLVTCALPLLWHCRDAACRVSVPQELKHDHIGRKNRPDPEVAAPPGRGPTLLACALVRARRRAPAERECFRRSRPRRSRSRTAAPAGRTRIALRVERAPTRRLKRGLRS